MADFVSIRHYRSMTEALVAKSFLQSRGVECYLNPGASAQPLPYAGVDGIDLRVRLEDQHKAKLALSEVDSGEAAVSNDSDEGSNGAGDPA